MASMIIRWSTPQIKVRHISKGRPTVAAALMERPEKWALVKERNAPYKVVATKSIKGDEFERAYRTEKVIKKDGVITVNRLYARYVPKIGTDTRIESYPGENEDSNEYNSETTSIKPKKELQIAKVAKN